MATLLNSKIASSFVGITTVYFSCFCQIGMFPVRLDSNKDDYWKPFEVERTGVKIYIFHFFKFVIVHVYNF
jgi:hypothetical protein